MDRASVNRRMKAENTEMGTQQLLDALTDHLALYHRKASQKEGNLKGSSKEKALQWFISLSVEQRRSAVTICDKSWVAIVLQMHRRLAKEGRGYFLVLPDVPDRDPVVASGMKKAEELDLGRKFLKTRKKPTKGVSAAAPTIALPGLCFRKARGLLTRLDEEHVAGELFCDNLELFSSVEKADAFLHSLDTFSISEDFLSTPDRFFASMNTITCGEFLSSIKAGRQDSSWEELPWLQNMGYYTMSAFVANKVELAMQSAWLQDEGRHRPPKYLSKELRKTGLAKAPKKDFAAMTVLNRYKCFKDWWMTLGEDVRFKMLRLAVARVLSLEAVRASHSTTKSVSPMAWREAHSGQFHDKVCLLGTAEVLGNVSLPASYIVGLDALQSLVSSPLCIALGLRGDTSQVVYGDASRAAQYKWLLSSCLDSAETLPGNIRRLVSRVLQEVMVKYKELDLLKSEVCASQTPPWKARKESRRKKSRSSGCNNRNAIAGNEVEKALLRLEEKPRKTPFHNETSEEHHEETKRHGAEKSKLNKKKKKHAREILRDDPNGASSAATIVCKEEKISPRSTLKDESEMTKNVQNVKELDSSLMQDDNQELCAAQSLNAEEHSSIQHIESNEDDDTCGSSTVEPSKTVVSQSNVTSVNKDMHKSAPQEKNSSGKAFNELCVSDKISLQLPHDETVANSRFTEDSHCTEGTSCGVQSAGMLMHMAVSINDLDKRLFCEAAKVKEAQDLLSINDLDKRLSCEGAKVKEAQDLLSPLGHLPHTPCLLRSPLPCPTSRERHWEGLRSHTLNSKSSTVGLLTAHEWPGTFQVCFPRGRSQVMSPTTERLHLDVDRNWQQRLHASFITLRNPIMKQQLGPISNAKRNSTLKSSDITPLLSPVYAPNRSYPYGYREETGVCSMPQTAFSLPFVGPEITAPPARAQEELKHDDRTPDDTDYDDSNYFSGDIDDHEGFIVSEEESERQLTQGEGDYNQFFGGGVMFWNTADYAGTGYSRPPSLSSEDSSWARHEADLSVVLDDIMGFPSMPGPYASVASPGMVSTSPPTSTFHPGFEHSPISTNARVGLPMSGNEFVKFSPLPSVSPIRNEDEQALSSSDVMQVGSIDGIAQDIVSIPVLRPIIVVRERNLGRQPSGSESIRHHETRSPHVPRGRRDIPWQRRPPSPVLRCVPPSPPPPPPSPVSGFGKRKGFTTARSGSSSPRRWGLSNAYHKEEQDIPFVLSEVLESAWSKRNMRDKASIHPISGSLVRERLLTLAVEKDHPDIALPMQTTILFNSNPSLQSAISRLHNVLHQEIEVFCKQVAAENLLRKASISTAVDKVAHAMQVLWPRSRLKVFGSTATGLALPSSDVDLVVCLPPVRNLEPIKEAGILEGRNGIKETCLQHAARYLADQDWVKSDALKTVENTTIPIIMLVAHVSSQLCSIPYIGDSVDGLHANEEKESSNNKEKGPWGGSIDRKFVRLDISFEGPSHTGLRTAELVRELTTQFPAIIPLALVLKQFLTDRSLDQPYTGGLSSYCLVILITRFLQHQHHLGWPFQQNLGSLLMDFLHFFGCVFDPRRMGICIRGGGMYVSRDRGHSIDPLHIEDPLYRSNNVGRNCFRILQCVKAFADAYSYLENALVEFAEDSSKVECLKVLPNILPSLQSLNLCSQI